MSAHVKSDSGGVCDTQSIDTDIMSVLERLLADVACISGLRMGTAKLTPQWAFNKAPLLEKHLLAHIEHGALITEDFGVLEPLVRRFLESYDPMDLRLIRQVLLFCYKAEHKHTDEIQNKAYQAYSDCNAAVGSWSEHSDAHSNSLLASVIKHCSSVLGGVRWGEIIPHHGPGAVFDGNTTHKGSWSKWFSTIESCYPYAYYMDTNNGHSNYCYSDRSNVATPEVSDCIVARVCAVPKDCRGPRLICIHPTESIWIQQGLRHKLEWAISRDRPQVANWIWPKGHIHFDDQTINGQLARKASFDQSYATLDLKEASDRLSDRLVQVLFGRHYKWFGSCRAHKYELSRRPGVTEIDWLHSYAPMGNATTFPVQSLVFWSVCVSTMQLRGHHSPGDCYVFGDDIIVPSCMAPACMEALSSFGLVVNHEKSFYKGFFRESCGVDAYKGIDVTPVRWKTTYHITTLQGLQSLSSIAQRLRLAGFELAAEESYRILRHVMKNCLGLTLGYTNNADHGGIAEFTQNWRLVRRYTISHRKMRECNDYQIPVTRIHRLHSLTREFKGDRGHLLSSLTSLERTGRSCSPATMSSRAFRITRGWAEVL